MTSPPAPLDPAFDPLRARIIDPLVFRALRVYIERRRQPGTDLAGAVRAVLAEVDRGNLGTILEQAAKPDAIWREEQDLTRRLHDAVRPFAGYASNTDTVSSVRKAVEDELRKRYPKKSPRLVRRVVKDAVRFALRGRLEIRSAMIVSKLSDIRP
jgi:hypothetical protein